MAILETKQSRRLWAGVALTAVSLTAAFLARRSYKPWIPEAPMFRQKGAADAKAVIVEFSDFQCPGCAAAVTPIKQFEGLYGPRLKVLFKHLPWDFHPKAKRAAAAAECAGRQGKFWDMHDTLFLKQAEWAQSPEPDTLLISYAKTMQLDPLAFSRCLEDPSIASAIESDAREAKDHWINSTPSFFINGKRFVGIRQLRTEGMREIDRILAL